MNDKYILDASGKPVPEPDLLAWGKWFQDNGQQRIVKKDKIGDSTVSTVFLGLDHNFAPDGPPLIWETMVFEGPMAHEMDRCSGNREQAEAMHARMVGRVKQQQRKEL
jgi:hypothetical protein